MLPADTSPVATASSSPFEARVGLDVDPSHAVVSDIVGREIREGVSSRLLVFAFEINVSGKLFVAPIRDRFAPRPGVAILRNHRQWPSIQRQSTVNQSPRTKTAAALEFVRQTEGWGRMADGTGVSVSVRVLGEVAIAYDGIALPLPESLRAVALLGRLAAHGGSRTRSEIASSLWPDVPDAARRRVDVADGPSGFPSGGPESNRPPSAVTATARCTSRAIPTSRCPRLSMYRVTTAA